MYCLLFISSVVSQGFAKSLLKDLVCPICSKGEQKRLFLAKHKKGVESRHGDVEAGGKEKQKEDHLHIFTQGKGKTNRSRTDGQCSPINNGSSSSTPHFGSIGFILRRLEQPLIDHLLSLLSPGFQPHLTAEDHSFIGFHTTILAFLLTF